MGRQVRIDFLESETHAVADLLDDRAPATCDAIWGELHKPIERRIIHAASSGQNVLFYDFPEIPTIQSVPLENHKVRAWPGEIMFFYQPAGRLAGMTAIREWMHSSGNIFEVVFSYGHTDVSGPAIEGWRGCHWATSTQGLDGFAHECHRMRIDGA